MAQIERKWVLLVAVVLAGAGAALAWSFLSSLQQESSKGTEEVSVLVARSYIPEATNINSYMVKIAKIPLRYVQPKAFTSPKNLVDEKGHNIYFTAVPVEEGEQILSTKLVTAGGVIGLAPAVPQGKRAVSITVDKASRVADLIKPGDRVDVLATFEYTSEKKGKQVSTNETITALQDILVLACGQEITGAKKTEKKKSIATFGGTEETHDTVTLAVAPSEAQIISFCRKKGSLSLALRRTGETGIAPIPKTSFDSLLEGKPATPVTTKSNMPGVKKMIKEEIEEYTTEME